MDLTGFRVAVNRNLGSASPTVEADVNLPYANVLDAYVNQALQRLAVEGDWPWLHTSETIATVAGTGTYAVAANYLHTRNVSIDDQPPLTRATLAEMDERYYLTSDRGVPALYSIEAGQVYIRPLPDAVYTLRHRYVRTEAVLTNGSDTPLLPATFHEAAVCLATALAGEMLGKPQQFVDFWMGQVYHDSRGWLRKMQDDRTRTWAPFRIKVRSGHGWG